MTTLKVVLKPGDSTDVWRHALDLSETVAQLGELSYQASIARDLLNEARGLAKALDERLAQDPYQAVELSRDSHALVFEALMQFARSTEQDGDDKRADLARHLARTYFDPNGDRFTATKVTGGGF